MPGARPHHNTLPVLLLTGVQAPPRTPCHWDLSIFASSAVAKWRGNLVLSGSFASRRMRAPGPLPGVLGAGRVRAQLGAVVDGLAKPGAGKGVTGMEQGPEAGKPRLSGHALRPADGAHRRRGAGSRCCWLAPSAGCPGPLVCRSWARKKPGVPPRGDEREPAGRFLALGLLLQSPVSASNGLCHFCLFPNLTVVMEA